MSVRSRMVYLFAAMLLFTSIGRAENAKLEQRVYQVTDLVIPLGDTPKSEKAAAPALRTTGWAASRKAVTCEDRLIKLITTTISPRSWSQRGGRGTIDYFPLTMSIVINQTPAIQDKIAELLAAQRRIQDMEVSVEVKFATVTEELFQNLQGRGFVADPNKKAHAHENVAFLNHAQMIRFMEAIQEDVDTNVMQAPRMTMFNGQAVACNCSDYQTFVTGLEIVHCDDHIEYRPKHETIPLGVQLDVRSVVSADRHSVRVHLNTSLSNLASFQRPPFPITTPDPSKENGPDGKPQMVTHYIDQPQVVKQGIKRTLVIPDGNTAVLTGLTRKCVVRNEYGPPILTKLPIVGNWFRSVAYGCHTHHLLVLVTPRIHVNEEEEEKKPRTLPELKAKDCLKVGSTSVAPESVPPSVEEQLQVKYPFKNENRTPIIEPIRADEKPQCEEPPDEAWILRAMPPIKNQFPGLITVSRDNIQIVVEHIVDKIDPPDFFPLIGPAQLHHSHWKCEVYYIETIECRYFFSFHCARPRKQLLFIDKDHLHLVAEKTKPRDRD